MPFFLISQPKNVLIVKRCALWPTDRQTRKWIQRKHFQAFRNFPFKLSSIIGAKCFFWYNSIPTITMEISIFCYFFCHACRYQMTQNRQQSLLELYNWLTFVYDDTIHLHWCIWLYQEMGVLNIDMLVSQNNATYFILVHKQLSTRTFLDSKWLSRTLRGMG